MRKYEEIFKLLWIQKRIVAAATIWGNTVGKLNAAVWQFSQNGDLVKKNGTWSKLQWHLDLCLADLVTF